MNDLYETKWELMWVNAANDIWKFLVENGIEEDCDELTEELYLKCCLKDVKGFLDCMKVDIGKDSISVCSNKMDNFFIVLEHCRELWDYLFGYHVWFADPISCYLGLNCCFLCSNCHKGHLELFEMINMVIENRNDCHARYFY